MGWAWFASSNREVDEDMTKIELLKEIDKIFAKLTDTIDDLRSSIKELEHLQTDFENLPQDEDEIENSEAESDG